MNTIQKVGKVGEALSQDGCEHDVGKKKGLHLRCRFGW